METIIGAFIAAILAGWFWTKVVRNAGAWVNDRVKPGWVKDLLNKDLGGRY